MQVLSWDEAPLRGLGPDPTEIERLGVASGSA